MARRSPEYLSVAEAELACGMVPRAAAGLEVDRCDEPIARHLRMKKNRGVRELLLFAAVAYGDSIGNGTPIGKAAEFLRRLYQSLLCLAAQVEFAHHADALKHRPATGAQRRHMLAGSTPFVVATAMGPIVIHVPRTKSGNYCSNLPLRASGLRIGRIIDLVSLLGDGFGPDRAADMFGELCGVNLNAENVAWLCLRLAEEHARFFGRGAAIETCPTGAPAQGKFWVRDPDAGRILAGGANASCSAFLAKRRAAEKPSFSLALRQLGNLSWVVQGKGVDLLSSELGEELAPAEYCDRLSNGGAAALMRLVRAPAGELVAAVAMRGSARAGDVQRLFQLAAEHQAVAAVLVAHRIQGGALRRLHEANSDSFPGRRAHFGLELVRAAGHLNSTLVKFRCVCGPSQAVPSRVWLARRAERLPGGHIDILERLESLRAGYRILRGNRARPHIGFRGRHLRSPLAHCDVCLEAEPGAPSMLSVVFARPARRQNRALCAQLMRHRRQIGPELELLGRLQWPAPDTDLCQIRLEIVSRAKNDAQLLADIIAAERVLLPRMRLHRADSFAL